MDGIVEMFAISKMDAEKCVSHTAEKLGISKLHTYQTDKPLIKYFDLKYTTIRPIFYIPC